MDIDELPTIDQLSEADQKDVNDMLWGEGKYSQGYGLKSKTLLKCVMWAKPKVQKLTVYSAAGPYGIVQCVTCPQTHVYNSRLIHGGHFISAKKSMRTALMLENISPQCNTCNALENGKAAEYESYLGEWTVNWLKQEASKPNPWDIEKIAIYMNQIVNPGLKEARANIKRMTQMVNTHGVTI